VKRKTRPQIDDYPAPWEERPVSRERWHRHRRRMMASAAPGQRPLEWWLYEKRREEPEHQALVLRNMGELQAGELAKCMQWWRDDFDAACEVFTVGSYGTLKRTPAERQRYLDFKGVPPDLVEQWDAERKRS
jgi:hypothetical protein